MRFGRIYNGVVVAVTEPPLGRTIEQHVGESQATYYTELPDDASIGYTQQLDGSWLSPTQGLP